MVSKISADTYKHGNVIVESGDIYYITLRDGRAVIGTMTIDKFQDVKDLYEILSHIVADEELTK